MSVCMVAADTIHHDMGQWSRLGFMGPNSFDMPGMCSPSPKRSKWTRVYYAVNADAKIGHRGHVCL